MFRMLSGETKRKKPTQRELLEDAQREVVRLTNRLEIAEAKLKSLLAEKVFWSENALQLTNNVETWMRMYRQLLEQTMSERQDVDLRGYAKAIGQAIEEGKPRTAEVAACIAMAGRDTQGVAPLGFDPGLAPRQLGSVIDVGDNGDSA